MGLKLLLPIILSGQLSFAIGAELTPAASEVKSEAHSGRVEFEAIGRPNMLKISGAGDAIEVKLKIQGNKLSGEVIFKLESLKTGLELRDDLMKEKYLQIQDHPIAKIVFEEFQMPAGWTLRTPRIARSSFRGKLFLHGVEREITGLYAIDPKQLKTTASFDIKLSDFKIETPVYSGIKVADFVKINVTIDKMTVVK